jgi:hypothetical protein
MLDLSIEMMPNEHVLDAATKLEILILPGLFIRDITNEELTTKVRLLRMNQTNTSTKWHNGKTFEPTTYTEVTTSDRAFFDAQLDRTLANPKPISAIPDPMLTSSQQVAYHPTSSFFPAGAMNQHQPPCFPVRLFNPRNCTTKNRIHLPTPPPNSTSCNHAHLLS